jgi:hypothetical protein
MVVNVNVATKCQELFIISRLLKQYHNIEFLNEKQRRIWYALDIHRKQLKEAKKTRRKDRRRTPCQDIIKRFVRMTCNYFICVVCRFAVLCRVLCQIANRNNRMNVQNIIFMCGFLYRIYRIFLLCKTII